MRHCCLLPPLKRLGTQKRLDRAPLVHCTVALRYSWEGQGQVEHLAGIDFPFPHQIDQLGQEAAHRRGAAVEVDMAVEQLLSAELDPVRDPDIADETAGPRRMDRL